MPRRFGSRYYIGNVTGLQAALDGKLASGSTAVAATKLATARTISLTGDVTGSASFNGTANINISATVANNSHTHDTSTLSGSIDLGTF